MYNTFKEIILKKKRGNFEINSNRWTLKLDDYNLYIKKFFKNYKIDLKKLISITLEGETIKRGDPYVKADNIKIEFLKDKKIKTINLIWKKEVYTGKRLEPIYNKEYVDSDMVYSLLNFFIRQSDVTDERKMQDMDYIFIREDDENDYIREICEKRDKKNKIMEIIFIVSPTIILILTVIITIMIGVLENSK